MKKDRRDFVPPERWETLRREIMAVLEDGTVSAREISGEVRIPEKEVYGHLEHIRKSVGKRDAAFVVVPAECRKCGYVFRKRERLTKPGRCPVCKGESIREPLFAIEKAEL